MKYILLNLSNFGGEYTLGYIKAKEDSYLHSLINNSIQEKNLISYNTPITDSFNSFNISDFDNILHIIAPTVVNQETIIDYSIFKDYELTDLVLHKNFLLGDIQSNIFSEKEAYPYNSMKDKLQEEDLIIGGFSIDSKLEYKVLLTLEDNDFFNLNNIFIGTTNLDTILGYDEVVTSIYYLKNEVQEELVDMYMLDTLTIKDRLDCLKYLINFIFKDIINNKSGSELGDYSQERKDQYLKILNDNKLELISIIPTGRFAQDYIIVRDKNDNEIFRKENL